MVLKIGYVTVSNKVMVDGQRISYLYREKPDNEGDSGWRVFSGDEAQDYADNPENFALYNASTVIEMEPSLVDILPFFYPVTFEREGDGDFVIKVDG